MLRISDEYKFVKMDEVKCTYSAPTIVVQSRRGVRMPCRTARTAHVVRSESTFWIHMPSVYSEFGVMLMI